MILIKSPTEIETMKEAGRITAGALRVVGEAVRVGITTKQLDAIAEEYIRSEGAKPAFLGYNGFKGTLCTSLNEQVVHGIPGSRALKDGDILSVDCGAIVDGYYGDAAMTFGIGEVSKGARKLMEVTRASLIAGIAQCRPNMRLYDIGHAVQQMAEAAGFSVVREYVGHGIGQSMHEEPQIPNFGRAGTGPQLKAGMVLAVEPMVNAGGHQVRGLNDGWTVVTADGSLSAHFEHTIAITADGPLVLTVE
ncbi:MAG: type I methionyl aminopeptidase [Coriobacteriia bacterium]